MRGERPLQAAWRWGRQAIVEALPQSLIRLTLHAGGKHDASASPVVPTDPPQAEGNMKGKRREA